MSQTRIARALAAGVALLLGMEALDPPRGRAAAAPPAQHGDINAIAAPSLQTDYRRRNVSIPMRDGVSLHAVIVLPKGATRAPLVLERTPYSADKLTHLGSGPSADANLIPLHADLLRAGYVVVLADVRGKYGSDGDYVLTKPLTGPLNRTGTDNATDAYDTIDWLVKHVPEANGRVATIGISYDGFTALMSLVHPHPALKASVPIDPMVDAWAGDDWFHHGAYRQLFMEYIYRQTARKDSTLLWPNTDRDIYEGWLSRGSAGSTAKAFGVDQLPFWRRLAAHPDYDPYWSSQALDRILAAEPLTVPMLLVHAQWDQEDIYGAPAVLAALQSKLGAKDKLFFAMGPWGHGGAGLQAEGANLGAIRFGSDTSQTFRDAVLIPFLDAYLKDGGAGDAHNAGVAGATVFETGANVWRRYAAWPPMTNAGRPLYLRAGARLSFEAPAAGEAASDAYVSDPARPVTYRPRPIRSIYDHEAGWDRWLVDDQRFADGRPDVLIYTSQPLVGPLRLAGQPKAHLVASTSGQDCDWIVKLIDVYPAQTPRDPTLGGYELPLAMEVVRARYRADPARPLPVRPDEPTVYNIDLPIIDHVVQPGHRLMVQVQSSWFPLYDRNPQTYVPNIIWAKPEDYVKATQTVFHTPERASFVSLPVVR